MKKPCPAPVYCIVLSRAVFFLSLCRSADIYKYTDRPRHGALHNAPNSGNYNPHPEGNTAGSHQIKIRRADRADHYPFIVKQSTWMKRLVKRGSSRRSLILMPAAFQEKAHRGSMQLMPGTAVTLRSATPSIRSRTLEAHPLSAQASGPVPGQLHLHSLPIMPERTR